MSTVQELEDLDVFSTSDLSIANWIAWGNQIHYASMVSQCDECESTNIIVCKRVLDKTLYGTITRLHVICNDCGQKYLITSIWDRT